MNHTEIINLIIKKFNHRNYLEIGVSKGINFNAIDCYSKTSVDPDKLSRAQIHKTSDDFFASNEKEFDCIFIDGLHESGQVYRDIVNSKLNIAFNGTIIVHDLLPETKLMQEVPRKVKEWTGDGWRAWIRFRRECKTCSMFVVDCDYGVGIIRFGNETFDSISGSSLSYELFAGNKKYWLNLISVPDFLKWIPNARHQERAFPNKISLQA